MKKLYRRLPEPLRQGLRALREHYRRARHNLRERLHPVRVAQADVERALRDLGIGPGDTVFVQTEMSAFGTIEGGPEAVIAAFRTVVGEEGLITMPAFSVDGVSAEYLARHPYFDARTTPSRMGAITERFRQLPGAVRSIHPTHSVAAQGPGAAELVAGHEAAATPFGEGTPFARLVECNATQVYFGTSTRPMTAYHVYECLRDPPYPYPIFLPEPVVVPSRRADGSEVEVRTLVHQPRLRIGRIDGNRRVELEMRRRLTAAGMRCVKLGRSDVLAMPMAEMIAAFETMLPDGVTVYDPPILEETLSR